MDKQGNHDNQIIKTPMDMRDLRRLYVKQGLSMREIASRLGLHADTIHYWLKKHGIETRSKAKRSKLRKYKVSTLEDGIKKHGVRGYARELGVHENTLRHYLRVRRKKGEEEQTNCVG